MSQYEWMCSSKESCTSSHIETSKKRIFFKKLGVVLFLLVNKKDSWFHRLKLVLLQLMIKMIELEIEKKKHQISMVKIIL